MVQWFDSFFGSVVAVGTLGAGFTFSVIFSTLESHDTRHEVLDTDLVRHFLIIAWLLFVLAVAIASVCAAIFRFMAREIIDGFNRSGNLVNFAASIASLVLQLLVVAAFLMSARALRRYDESTGEAAVVIVSVTGCLLIVAWLGMAM